MFDKDKWGYFQKKLEPTWEMYLEFLGKVNQESGKIYQAILVCKDKQDRERYAQYFDEVNLHYRNTLYGSMLIMFCSLMEHFVKEIAKEVVPEYEKKIKKEKKGDWFAKNTKLINEVKILDIAEKDVELFSCYIKIRNCIVHNAGVISNSRNSKELKEVVDKIQVYGHQHNCNLLQLKSDDYLLLGNDIISDVVVKIEDISERILEAIQDKIV